MRGKKKTEEIKKIENEIEEASKLNIENEGNLNSDEKEAQGENKIEKENKKLKINKKEKIENIDETEPDDKSEIEIAPEQLDTIADEISINKKNSQSNIEKNKKYKDVLKNVFVWILFVAYFGILLLGKEKIPTIDFIKDLKIITIMDLIVSIVLLEIGLKKDSSSLFIYGIELIFIGGTTMYILELVGKQNQNINIWISAIIGVTVLYYIAKSIILILRTSNKNVKK